MKAAIFQGTAKKIQDKNQNPGKKISRNKKPFVRLKTKKIILKTKKEKERMKKTTEKIKKKKKISDSYVQKSIHLYKIFNLNYGCTLEELKDSYRKLLKKYHPDNFEGFPETQKIAERKTRELISAFNKLLELIG